MNTATGWDAAWQEAFDAVAPADTAPARVVREDRGVATLLAGDALYTGEVSGRFRHASADPAAYPVTGDWAAAALRPAEGRAIIHVVLPRRSAFGRGAAGDVTRRQVLAANIDTAFLVSGLDHDFNPRRIERYVTLAYESGAAPVIVLNKADLHPDPAAAVGEAAAVAPEAPVCLVSANGRTGLGSLAPYLRPGATVALLGSSGVGKSTLINALLGEQRLATGAVREDDSRGRHTTTHRELVALPGGAFLIDTPGLRELQLWTSDESLHRAFGDVGAIAKACRFRDCTHNGEPGCAVRAAVERGELAEERLESYHKLEREAAYIRRKSDQRQNLDEKRRWKSISKEIRRHYKGR